MTPDRALHVTEATRDDLAAFVPCVAAEDWNSGRCDLEPPDEPVERIFGISSLELG